MNFLAQTLGSAAAQLADPIQYSVLVVMIISYWLARKNKLIISASSGFLATIAVELITFLMIADFRERVLGSSDLSGYMAMSMPGAILIAIGFSIAVAFLHLVIHYGAGLSEEDEEA